MQHALASYMKNTEAYLGLPGFYQRKRDLFRQGLAKTRLHLLPSEGSYFQCVDISAVSDLGLEFDAIVPGQPVAELSAGSFVVVRAEEAPAGAKPGTVKEVLNVGLYAQDEAGKKHFISPSKINVYKL
jgi:hypothetical protein